MPQQKHDLPDLLLQDVSLRLWTDQKHMHLANTFLFQEKYVPAKPYSDPWELQVKWH